MMAIAAAAAEIVLTFLVFAATNLAILALRNPHKGKWLRSPTVVLLIEMVAISAMLVVVPILGAGVFGVVPNLIAGSTILAILTIGIYIGVDRMMGMDRRLVACNAGQSPFRGDIAAASKPAA